MDSGVKIDQAYYKSHILESVLLPWSRSHFGNTPSVFLQDSAPAHKAKSVQAWCAASLPDFISSSEWPASSPDLNPLDYSIWSFLESKVNARPHPNFESLKRFLQPE